MAWYIPLICAKLLRKHARAAGLNSNFTILDPDDQTRLIKNICKSENIDTKKISSKITIAIIEKWKKMDGILICSN